MNPVLLQKQLRENTIDLQNFYKELQEWGDAMKRKDEPCTSGEANGVEASPPRSKVQKTEHTNETGEEQPEKAEAKSPKRIKPCDYEAWEKFNVDSYCERLDKEVIGEPLSEDSSDDLSDECELNTVILANVEKEKGNAFVEKQMWDDAVKCYTSAIECYEFEPIFYANRALCHLKNRNYRSAESDCTTALQLNQKYVKAYQRRAAAREALNQLNEARDDLLRVLELEKKNAESKAALVKLEKKIEGLKQPVAEPCRPVSKFTLSRQKQKPLPPPEVTGSEEAVKSHVIEKLQPSKSDGWPSGSDVELFAGLPRPQKPRSSGSLKRIEIVDVDLQTGPQEYEGLTKCISEIDWGKASVSNREEETLKLVEQISKLMPPPPQKEIVKQVVATQESSDLQIPKTSVQFYKRWRSIGPDQDLRRRYMEQIEPKELPHIFKESLESKVFSEMIETLSASKDRKCIYEWLTHLTNVKRFSALAMFMSAVDKKRVSDLVGYLKEDDQFGEVEELRKKYEL